MSHRTRSQILATASAPEHGAIPLLRRGRAVHLVDLDNQLNTSDPQPGAAGAWWEEYRRLVGPSDAVFVATSHRSAVTTWWELPPGRTRLMARSGADGADEVLLESLDLRHAAARFDYLIVASEDHYFVPVLRAAARAGLTTWLVTSARPAASGLVKAARLHSRLRVFPLQAAAARPAAA